MGGCCLSWVTGHRYPVPMGFTEGSQKTEVCWVQASSPRGHQRWFPGVDGSLGTDFQSYQASLRVYRCQLVSTGPQSWDLQDSCQMWVGCWEQLLSPCETHQVFLDDYANLGRDSQSLQPSKMLSRCGWAPACNFSVPRTLTKSFWMIEGPWT